MSLELNITNLIAISVAILTCIATLIKFIAVLFERSIKRDLQARFETLDASSKAQYEQINMRLTALDSAFKLDAAQWQRVERELLTLKAELPLHYVRREDYIRGQTVMEAKQDALYSRIELLQQQIQSFLKAGVQNNG